MGKFILSTVWLLLAAFAAAQAQGPPRAAFAAGAPPLYDLHVRLMPDAQRLEAAGTLRLPADEAPRDEIRLSLSELMSDLTVEVLEPAVCAGPAVVERRGASGESVKWAVRPARPVPTGEAVKLRFSYAGGGRAAYQFYVGPEVSFASGWGTDWYPLPDVAEDKGVGTLRFSVPAGLVVYATGDGRTRAEDAGQGRYRFEVKRRTYFTFVAGRYTVARRPGAIPVSAYLLRPRPNTKQYLDGVSRILTLLAREFGAYRFGEFALVEVPTEVASRARFSGAAYEGFFFSTSSALDAPEFNLALPYLAHEFSHEWFPHQVALKRGRGRFTEEALAQYGSLRVVEAVQGRAAAEQYRRAGLWNYAPDFSALGYFKMVGAGSDQRLADLQGEAGRRLAYTKGFLVWDMLSREVGRERFRRVMRGVTRRYAFGEVSWDGLLRAVEAGAGRDLGWFYDQWFERAGAPEFRLTWRQEGRRLRGSVAQTAPHYRASLEIEVIGGRGQRLVRTVRVRGAQTPFSFPVNFRAESVTLDPRYLVLRWTPEFRAASDNAKPASP